ncbi:hypothetical protein Cgig2_012358 [Carnegiea gigantea]|uniref:DNA-directed RNA polymerase insert domain-containing protein n=1 Tax=Carnegiea gigantea TaxID=171969 RepID=A0A9Q1KM08_9CARY|nr:hypothetical protein Cgig2_012358 [Carnegiea gigantea]
MKHQADPIHIAMRRALLREIEGTCITRAKSEKIPRAHSTIVVHKILMNLKDIVLGINLCGTCEASICVKGPRCVTAHDIILRPYAEIIDNTQYMASMTEPIDLHIRLQLEKNYRYYIKAPNNFQDKSFPLYALFMPHKNMKNTIVSYGNGNEKL